jgi:hypothetical protein
LRRRVVAALAIAVAVAACAPSARPTGIPGRFCGSQDPAECPIVDVSNPPTIMPWTTWDRR